MTKAELIERIARSRNLPPDITKKEIAQILGIAFEELATYFAKTRVTRTTSPRFTFPRFGTFTKKKRSARRGVNPRTLEPMTIDAFCTLDFKASRELREQMNGTRTATTAKPKPKPSADPKPAKNKKTVTKRSVAKKTTRRKSTSVKSAGGKRSGTALGGRRLTPRDEDAELDALIDDDSLFVELPASRLQRVRPSGDDDAANTG